MTGLDDWDAFLNAREPDAGGYPARHPEALFCIFDVVTGDGVADRQLDSDSSRANDALYEEGWGPLIDEHGERMRGAPGYCYLQIDDVPPEPRDVRTRYGNVRVHRSYADYLAADDKVAWFREGYIRAMTLRAEALGIPIPEDAARE